MQTLIKTKYQRPRLGPDLISRPHLIQRLNQSIDRKFTLISAQAGAGKSTLLLQWLEECPRPSAWLSLDKQDNDLVVFSSYLCAAIQEIYPEACQKTSELLSTSRRSPPRTIITQLVNELDVFFRQRPTSGNHTFPGTGLILALDDYHNITNQEIHELIAQFINYLPEDLHLVLTTRIDPPLPLAGLRARSEMSELRTTDLRFSASEATALLKLAAGRDISSETIDLLADKTDGWAVGLLLAGISMRYQPDGKAIASGFRATGNLSTTDYLVAEVLAKQTKAHQDFLLCISILDRFCAELCEWVLRPEDTTGTATTFRGSESAAAILRELVAANVFLIPLDREGRWYRFHHLFQDLLQHQLRTQYSAQEVSILHIRASHWFESRGLIDEALNHAFASGELERAARIVERQRYALMNQARWQRLNLYLSRFPPQFVDEEPDLLMLRTWLLYHDGQINQLPAALDRVASALGKRDLAPEKRGHLEGEINTLRSLLSIGRADIVQTITEAKSSLKNTPPELWIVRTLGRLTLAGAYMAQGAITDAYETVYGGIGEEVVESNSLKATTFLSACTIHWLVADMPGLAAAASKCIELSNYPHAGQIERHARHHLGNVHYLQDDLVSAEEQYQQVVQQPYLNYGEAFAHSAFGLSLTYQAQNRPHKALEVAELAHAHMLESGNMTLLPLANAFQAEIAVRQGDLAIAAKWAEQFRTTPPMGMMYRFYEPRLTLVKTWLEDDTRSSRQRASELLGQLRHFSEATHSKIVLISVLALSAIMNAAVGDDPVALESLGKALELAEPGAIVRLFTDLGRPMQRLIERLTTQDTPSDYMRRLLSSFDETSDAGEPVGQGAPYPPKFASQFRPPAVLVERLTARETEVLKLLDQRMTNKEIAKELFISPQTVKSHTLSIYAKLDVHGRRKAVDKARQLGLLDHNPR